MAPNERAQHNHDALFPNHVSTLATTDPALIDVFDNFAFDEVLRDSRLDARTRLMVPLAIIASHAVGEFRVILGVALNVGVTPVEAKEIVYQAIPYVGLTVTHQACRRPFAQYVGCPPSTHPNGLATVEQNPS
jgi:4-carboxymuconolactone decarboxylase